MMLSLDSDIRAMAGVGQVLARKLKILGITTVRDLVFYFPYRFDDFTRIVSIRDLKASETVTIRGTIRLIQNRRSWKTRKIVTEALVSDDTAEVKVIWFNQPFLIKNLSSGDFVSLSGRTSDNFYDLQVVNPVYEKVSVDEQSLHTGGLVPVYSLVAGITKKQFRTLIKKALDECLTQIQDFLPEYIVKAEKFFSLQDAVRTIHFPDSLINYSKAKQRLVFDELFLIHAFTGMSKKNLVNIAAYAIPFDEKVVKEFLKNLPFSLTKSQKIVSWEIMKDMSKSSPMNRLLEGDVGAGKTIVASMALLGATHAGYQVALMAPTEVLAKQHFETFVQLFSPFLSSIALLTSSGVREWTRPSERRTSDVPKQSKKKMREDIYQRIKTGSIQFVIGTHALLEDTVSWNSLALAIIDEQHRFGVGQRKRLREGNAGQAIPHLLSMTATPIPRSLALTVYGDLDLSILKERPYGRKSIITKLVPEQYRTWVYDFIRKEVSKGHQGFIICPLIDVSDALEVRSVKEEYMRLQEGALRDIRIGILHGKMKPQEKGKIMHDMLERKIDVLLSTSVVEVGIDIPNATFILIEGAERFGLAQLHQFRGRVGRSELQSYCFVLPTESKKEERARLKIFVSSNDGFYLADKDLELRGEGDVLGSRQSGMPFLKLTDLRDADMLKKSREYAAKICDQLSIYPLLQAHLEKMEADVHLE
ncbi:ATP-dependent DNA helicase RecG [Candidatus Uhrbacteria bacterium]|nr:ATP-dependent DNA helicase RecG [Candidatus Uhrbacteria bacterium]